MRSDPHRTARGPAIWLAWLPVALAVACSSPAGGESGPADNAPATPNANGADTAVAATGHPGHPGHPVRPAQPDPAADPRFPAAASATGDGVDVFCDGDAAFAATWHAVCIRLLRKLREVFPPRHADPAPPTLRVLVFGSRERYREWADAHAPENADVSGYHDPVTHEVVATDTGDTDALTATLAHELTHAALRDHLGTRFLPPWLDEGIASVYETARIDDASGEITFGEIHHAYARMVARRLHADSRLDLRKVATMGYDLFANRDRGLMLENYAVAWSLVWYILHGERGLYHGMLRLYLIEIAAVTDRSTRYAAAYDTVIRPRADALLAGWRVWAASIDDD